MLRGTNIKHSKICAFCKYWYDPMNLAIRPQNTVAGAWQYEDSIWNVCRLHGTKRSAGAGCVKYVGKIQVGKF